MFCRHHDYHDNCEVGINFLSKIPHKHRHARRHRGMMNKHMFLLWRFIYVFWRECLHTDNLQWFIIVWNITLSRYFLIVLDVIFRVFLLIKVQFVSKLDPHWLRYWFVSWQNDISMNCESICYNFHTKISLNTRLRNDGNLFLTSICSFVGGWGWRVM